MSLSLQEVEKIASLARLELSAAEKIQYKEQLSAILEYAERLNELDITNIQPTTSAATGQNVLREDIVEPSLPTDEALFNAAKVFQKQFQIQPVLDEE
jgi:aspartyl-tRNA(Asn)/glutamyl-tRNA(Gln) amidotransferase subunit C